MKIFRLFTVLALICIYSLSMTSCTTDDNIIQDEQVKLDETYQATDPSTGGGEDDDDEETGG